MAQATALINNISATFFHKVLTSKSEKCQTLLKYSSHRDFEGSAQTLWVTDSAATYPRLCCEMSGF